jgi:hypothetical protein
VKRFAASCVTMAVIVLMGIFGCTTTTLTSVWKDETFKPDYFKSVVVAGLTENRDAREIFETVFVREFDAIDVRAVPSLSIIREHENLTPNRLIQEAAANQLDTVLMARLIEIAEKISYQTPINDPLIDMKGGITRHENYRLESKLYETETGKMIWSASSETVDPKNVNSAIESMVNAVMKELRTSHFFR